MAQEGEGLGKLTLRRAPLWQPEVMDTGIEMHDCLPATLFGRRGVLVVQRYMQVRFYEPPQRRGERWPYREIYSFYTASNQTGLLLADVNGDGRSDILCGNYWIRSPDRFELPWRLFAINLYSDQKWSAAMRMGLLNGPKQLVVSQGEMESAQLVVFSRPSDPRQLWPETRLSAGAPFRFPHGLAVYDWNGDGEKDILVGENAGKQSRLFMFWRKGAGAWQAKLLGLGTSVLSILVTAQGAVYTVGPAGVSGWTYDSRR